MPTPKCSNALQGCDHIFGVDVCPWKIPTGHETTYPRPAKKRLQTKQSHRKYLSCQKQNSGRARQISYSIPDSLLRYADLKGVLLSIPDSLLRCADLKGSAP